MSDNIAEKEKLFHVEWRIDLWATTPEEAAEKALAIHRRYDSIATVFDVTDEQGNTTQIDIETL